MGIALNEHGVLTCVYGEGGRRWTGWSDLEVRRSLH